MKVHVGVDGSADCFRASSNSTKFCYLAVLVSATLASAAVTPSSAAADDIPSAQQLVELLDAKHAKLTNLEFEYDVASSLADVSVRNTPKEDDLSLRPTSEVLSLLEPESSQEPLDWISWTVKSDMSGGDRISSFYVYDGKTYRRFLRGILVDPRLGPKSTGLIDKGYNSTFLAENYFERILFMKLNGLSQNLEATKKSKSALEYRFVEQAEHLGHKGWLFERTWIPDKLKTTRLVLGEPVSMVAVFKTISIPDGKVLAEFQVEELAKFNGLFYPSKGRYSETESQRQYSFKVTAVRELDDRSRSTWFPQWPSGTSVRDVVTGKPFQVK